MAERKYQVSHSKAEAGGYRAYLDTEGKETKYGKTRRIIKTKWCKTKRQAASQAAAWRRMYL